MILKHEQRDGVLSGETQRYHEITYQCNRCGHKFLRSFHERQMPIGNKSGIANTTVLCCQCKAKIPAWDKRPLYYEI